MYDDAFSAFFLQVACAAVGGWVTITAKYNRHPIEIRLLHALLSFRL